MSTPTHQRQDLDRDLGLGSRIANEARSRVLNPDGSFNVRRRGHSFLESINVFHAVMTMPAGRLTALVGAAYLAMNVIFAVAYLLCGPDALGGHASGLGARFADAFFFSVQTLATIGYGRLTPNTFAANVIVTAEALTGLMGFALVTGILFSRFSRPTAAIRYSQSAVVAPYHGLSGFMFRIVNTRRNQLVEVQVAVSFSRMEDDDGRRVRRFYQLTLERAKVSLFPLHWVVVHPIDGDSPLHGETPESLGASDAEFFILLTATDETYSQIVHSRSSYRPAEVQWDMKFTNMFVDDPDGVPTIDLRRLDDVEPAPRPPTAEMEPRPR